MSKQQLKAVLTSRTTWLTGSLLVTALLTTAVAQDRAADRRSQPTRATPPKRFSATRPSPADMPGLFPRRAATQPAMQRGQAPRVIQPGPLPANPAQLATTRPLTVNAPPGVFPASQPNAAKLEAQGIPTVEQSELERKAAAARASVGLSAASQPAIPSNIQTQHKPVPETPPRQPAPAAPPAPRPPDVVRTGAAAAPGAVAPKPAAPSPAEVARTAATSAPSTVTPQPATPRATTSAPVGLTQNPATGAPELKPKEFYWLTPEERPYFISWSNVNLEKACHDLEEMTGLSMLGLQQLDPATKSKLITFQGTKLLKFDQMLTMVNELFVENGAWVVRRESYLVVRLLSEWYQHIGPERRYGSLEAFRNAKLPLWEVAAVVYDKPLQRPADVVANHAMDVVPFNTSRVTIVTGTNQLELKGFVFFIEQQIKDIEAFGATPADDGRKWVAYELKNATSGDAARLLQMMVPQDQAAAPRPVIVQRPPGTPGVAPGVQPQPESPGVSTAEQVEIQEDSRLGRLMVKASPAKHELIKELLDKYIDLPLKPGSKAEMILLKHTDPGTVVAIVQPLLGERQLYQPPAPQPRPTPPGVNPPPQPAAPPPTVITVGTTAVLTPMPARNSILVKANPDEMAIIRQYIEMVDVPGGMEKFQHIQLKYGSANSIANILNNTFGQRAGRGMGAFPPGEGQVPFRVTADTQSDRALVITGDPKDVADAKALIEQLDVNPEQGAVEKLVQLENTSPSGMAETLSARYGEGGGRYRYGGGGSSSLPRFIAEDASKSLIVVCREQMWSEIERLIKEIDSKSVVRGETRTYRLKHTNASTVANIMSQSFGMRSGRRMGAGSDPDAPNFQADPQSNVLLVTAVADVQERVARLVADLDQPGPAESAVLRPIQLESADAGYVAQKIEELFQSPSRMYRGNPHDVPVNVVPEPVSNRVLVSASEEDFQKAEELARQIDKDYAERSYTRRTFRLEHAPSFKVVQALQMMFPQPGGGRYGRSDSGQGGVRIIDVGEDIVVSAPKDKMAEVEKLVQQLDSDPARDNEIRTYTVKGAGSEGTLAIAQSLEQLFGGSGGSRNRWGGGSTSSVQFIGDRGSDLLFVSAPPARMPEIDAKVQEMIKASESRDLTLSIREFPVSRAKPEDVADLVQPLLSAKFDELRRGGRQYGSGDISVSAHPTGRRVLVAAPEALMPLAQELISNFDEPSTPTVVRIVALKTADAEELEDVIERAMEERSGRSSFRSSGRRSWGGWQDGGSWGSSFGSSRSRDSGELRVEAIESSNSLMLRGSEAKVAEAEALAKQLDEQAVPEGTMIRTYEIVHADVYDVVSVIEDMVGGGSSDYDDYGGSSYGGRSSRRGGRSSDEGVIVKTEYGNRIVVSASAEKHVTIAQLIEMKEQFAKEQQGKPDESGTTGMLIAGAGSKGEITKVYPVTGPVNEIAENLDKMLVGLLGFYDAPYVKSFPFANQVVVQGKPAHFKLVEQYLEELEKNPPPPKMGLMIRQVPGGMAQNVVDTVRRHAPLGAKINARPLSGRDRLAPLRKINEIHWDDPIPTTQPASPFVPPNTLGQIAAELAGIELAQAPRMTVATEPASTRPAAVSTQPTAVSTQPAARTHTPPSQGATVQPAPAAKPPVAPAATPAAPPPAAAAPAPPAAPAADSGDLNPFTAAAVEAVAAGEVQIRYDEESGLVYVIGPVPHLESVQRMMDDLIEQIEKLTEIGGEHPIRVFQVEHVDVTVAATILEQMFNDRTARPVPGQPGQQPQQQPAAKKPAAADAKDNEKEDEKADSSSRRRREETERSKDAAGKTIQGGERIRVFPDVRTHTLVVRAAKDDFPLIAELLLKIDRPSDRPPVDIRIFEITKLNAFDVEQAIKAILKIDDGRQMYGGSRMPFGPSGIRRAAGMGAYGQQAQMIEQLQQQMLELQALDMEGLTGESGEGKMKLNPAKDITITSDATTNTVIVQAPHEGMKLVETLINRLEKITIPVQIISFPLKNGDAEKVAAQLEKIFQGAGGRSVGIGGEGRSTRGSRGGVSGATSTRLGQDLKVSADARTNTVVVRALAADIDKIKELIDKLDTPSPGEVKAYPVEHGSAVDLAATLAKVFVTDPRAANEHAVKISADAETNTILVAAPESKQIMIAARIMELDKRVGETAIPKQIPLAVASASAVAEKLRTIFVSKGAARSGRNRISIEGDDNTGIVFVTAPGEMFKDIEAIARTLDTRTRQDVQIFKLKHAYASEVHGLFKDMLAQTLVKIRGSKASTDEVPIVTPDARTNSLIVMGTPAVFLAVEKVLKDIDVAPAGDNTGQTVAMFGLTKATAASIAATINSIAAGYPAVGGVPRPRAVAEPTANVVYIYGTKNEIDALRAQVIDPLEQYAAPMDTAISDFQIPLKYAKVEEVAKTLTDYFRNKAAVLTRAGYASLPPADRAVTVIADPATKHLLVTSSEKNKKLIDQLLLQMDTPNTAGSARQTKVFPLQYAEPSYTTQAIITAFGRPGQVSEIEQVKVVPELGTSSVVVSASEENMKRIEEMLLTLDRPGTGTQNPYTIEVVNAEPEDVAAALNEVYASRRTRTGRNPISITVPRGTRTLLVTCTEPELAQIKTLVAQLDQNKTATRDVRMIKVEKIPVEEMVNLLTEFMRRSGRQSRYDPSLIGDVKIVASTSASAVLLTGPPQRLEELEKLVSKIEASSAVAGTTTQPTGRFVKVIPLRNADPSSVAAMINQTYTRPGKIAENDRVTAMAEWTTNSLVVSAKAEKQEEIAKLIEELDSQPGNSSRTDIIKLQYARAEDLANVLNVTYRYGRRGRQGDQPVMISPDTNTNSLIVSAGRADLEGIKTTVAALDKPATSSIEELRIIPLQYVDAGETLTIMQEYLRKPGGGKSATGSNLIGDIRLQASPTLNALVVSGSPENIAKVEEIVRGIDKEIPGAGTAPRVIALKNATASVVAANLSRIFSDPTSRRSRNNELVPLILADDTTNSLIVRARTVDYNLIADMAETLDVKPTGLTTIDVVPVGLGVDVVALAREIEIRVNAGEKIKQSQQPGYRPAAVSVGADTRGPALIVTGSPELFPVVRDLVTKLEEVRPPSAASAATIVIPTRNVPGSDLKKILEQMIRANKQPVNHQQLPPQSRR